MSEITDDYVGYIQYSTQLWGYIDHHSVRVCIVAYLHPYES